MKLFLKAIIPMLLVYSLNFQPRSLSTSIYFDDSDIAQMRMGNGYYEVGLSKNNGAILYILDKTTGESVTHGSRFGCLWGAVFPLGSPDYVGGCSFRRDWDNQFNYEWVSSSNTLILNYLADSSAVQQLSATVWIKPSELSWFDMDLNLSNNWGYDLDYVLFPSDLVFEQALINEALLPVLPGIVLESTFFDQDRTYLANYPGYPGIFSDFVSISNSTGDIAIYSVNNTQTISPVLIGFIHDDEYIANSTYYYHSFGTGLADGESWTSPSIRIQISQDHINSIAAFKTANGFHLIPDLQTKFGAIYQQVAQSPLYKVGVEEVNLPFPDYHEYFTQLSAPAILHLIGFHDGGFDENYPDFLPPDSRWGTTAEFASMVEEIQKDDFLFMPYTNPTWWDDESPTLTNLPEPFTIQDIAVLDRDLAPVYEYYGSHGGYVMSPFADFVQQRLDQLVNEMTDSIPSDILFEDQVGARPWLFDYNVSSPSPSSYTQGWLGHAQSNSSLLLMTELGFDKLALYEAGFHGSVLLPEVFGYTNEWWGEGNWHYFPMTSILMRDKILFYQHDLAPETFAHNKENFAWDLTMGYMLSYDLHASEWGGGLDNEWISVTNDFQKHVISKFAAEKMVDYEIISDMVTQSIFDHFSVVRNWSDIDPLVYNGFVIAQNGVLLQDDQDSLTAGIFTVYNNQSLSPGDHFLIEERYESQVIVRQPMGANTQLTIEKLVSWGDDSQVIAWAFSKDGLYLGQVEVTDMAESVSFFYQDEISGGEASYYLLFKPDNLYLPFIKR